MNASWTRRWPRCATASRRLAAVSILATVGATALVVPAAVAVATASPAAASPVASDGTVSTAGAGAAASAVSAAAAVSPTSTGYGGSWTPTYNQDFPDPTVMTYNGVLYAYSTETVAANIPGAESTDPSTWSTVSNDTFPTLPSFASGGSTWAPSVEQAADGQFVMYYTAHNPLANDQCIGEATSSSPTGPFVDNNSAFVMCQDSLGGSIDPQIFEYPGGEECAGRATATVTGSPPISGRRRSTTTCS